MRRTGLTMALAVSLLAASPLLAAPPQVFGTAKMAAGTTKKQVNSKAPANKVSPVAARPTDGWVVDETENFRISRRAGYRVEAGLGARFESLRKELCSAWMPKATEQSWQPKCHIVLHATSAAYLQEVGPGGNSTSGSALVDYDQGRVTGRRIDVRGDREDWFTAAFAHELTHVVVADQFAAVAIPHWADEGMAILADTPDKRGRHANDLRAAITAGRHFRLAELLSLDGYPQPARMGAFYGQSASVVEFLATLGTKEQLVQFVAQGATQGYDAALRDVYSIHNVSDLERRWNKHLSEPKQVAVAPATGTKASQLAKANEPPMAIDGSTKNHPTMD